MDIKMEPGASRLLCPEDEIRQAGERLPNEILDLIYSFCDDKRTLKRIRLLNHGAARKAAEALFKNITVTQELPQILNFESLTFSALLKYVETVTLVRLELSCGCCEDAGCVQEGQRAMFNREQMGSRLTRALRRLKGLKSLTYQDPCMRETLGGIWPEDFAIVLFESGSSLHLEDLDLQFQDVSMIKAFCGTLSKKQLSTSLIASRSLKIISAKAWRPERGLWESRPLASALKHCTRHLQSLTLASECYDKKLFLYTGPHFDNLKTLTLQGFIVDTKLFRAAVRSSLPTLTTLKLSYIRTFNGHWSQFFNDLSRATQLSSLEIQGIEYHGPYLSPIEILSKSRPWKRLITERHEDLHACRDVLIRLDQKRIEQGQQDLYKVGRGKELSDQYYWMSQLSSSAEFAASKGKRHWHDGKKRPGDEKFLAACLQELGLNITF